MISWIFPVIVVNVGSKTVYPSLDNERGDTKFSDESVNLMTLSVNADFVKKHMNCVYMFKEQNMTPLPLYYFTDSLDDGIDVVSVLTQEVVGALGNDGVVTPYEGE